MMIWILLVMAGIAATVAAMLLGGAMAPRVRQASRSLIVSRPAGEVYARLREADGPPRWHAGLPTMRVIEEAPPQRLVLSLLDDEGGTVGEWRVIVTAGADGPMSTVATITESVRVDNLLLRFVRSLGGHGARPQAFLEAVARQLGEPARVADGVPSPDIPPARAAG